MQVCRTSLCLYVPLLQLSPNRRKVVLFSISPPRSIFAVFSRVLPSVVQRRNVVVYCYMFPLIVFDTTHGRQLPNSSRVFSEAYRKPRLPFS